MDQTKAKKFIIPIVILIAACIASLGIYFARTQQYKDWVSASGVVLDIENYHRKSSSSHRIYYSYSVDGTVYTGDSLYSGTHTDFKAGDETDVWYNPQNPAESSFHKPGPGLDPYAPFFIGVPLALGAFGWRRKRIRKQIDV
nr:DUF3592 domain-containing protein [uncultured Solibaculum sp.]